MFNGGKKYDVFISYRRGGGEWIARSLYYYLDRRGLKCFFDHHDMPNGHFNDALGEGIGNSDYFFSVIAKGTLPVRGNGDWFEWEWDCARELKAGNHIIPLAVDDPCDDAALDAFTGTVNRYAVRAGVGFEMDVNAVIERCDSLKTKAEKYARRKDASRTKVEKKFRDRSEKRLLKMSNMGISLYDPRCKCVRKELEADADQRGLTELQTKDILEEIDKSLNDKKNRRRWISKHPKTVCLIRWAAAIFVAWCVYKSAPFVYGMLPPERRAKVDVVAQEAVRGLGWLREKATYICNGTVKELSRSLR